MDCYVLAGGESRRMGRDKALLELDHGTFLDRVVGTARLAFESVFVVARAGQKRIVEGAPVIHEPPHEASAPIFGLSAALRHARAPKVWVLAVDYPLLTAPLLEWMRDGFEREDVDLFAPRWGGRPQMLCAGYGALLREEVERRTLSGYFRLQDLAAPGRAQFVEESEIRARFDGEQLWNVNLASDYEAVRRIHESERQQD